MLQPIHESTLIPGIRDRILNVDYGTDLLEKLISAARLDKKLLSRPTLTQTVFCLHPKRITIIDSPQPERLALVRPESFAFEWKLLVNGYFLVKHKFIDQFLPNPVDPFTIRYSGIIIPEEKSLRFKNERVELG